MFRSDLSPVHFHFRICHGSFKDKIHLLSAKLFGNFKFVLIHALLVGDPFGKSFTVKGDSVLISTKALQFPTGRNANLRPFAGVASVGTEEVPFYHVIASAAGKVLPFRLRKILSSQVVTFFILTFIIVLVI